METKNTLIRHFKTIKMKNQKKQIRNLDFIYLINLDKRPERLCRSIEQLNRYNIQVHRFSAIYGWDLSQATFVDIGMKFLPSMSFDSPVHFSPSNGQTKPFYLNQFCFGRSCVHYTMVAGALGCYLSHLSILKDADDAGYEAIWILEDDFTICENPNVLSDLIDRLDGLTSNEWDLLYTDNDEHFKSETVKSHMGGGNLGRPGIPMTSNLWEYQTIGSDFYKIGGRTGTHSIIYRKKGIRKILDFIQTNGIFRPYDLELALIPGLKMYNLSHDVVHGRNGGMSDTFYKII